MVGGSSRGLVSCFFFGLSSLGGHLDSLVSSMAESTSSPQWPTRLARSPLSLHGDFRHILNFFPHIVIPRLSISFDTITAIVSANYSLVVAGTTMCILLTSACFWLGTGLWPPNSCRYSFVSSEHCLESYHHAPLIILTACPHSTPFLSGSLHFGSTLTSVPFLY